nr:MAG TPA: hypothetical protein [Caudoviricetes sp.]
MQAIMYYMWLMCGKNGLVSNNSLPALSIR